MAGKRYLVTGGDGFIGSSLVCRLVKDGHKVRALDNDLRGVSRRLGSVAKDIEAIHADIRDPEATRKACRGVDVVCHLAYLNGTEFFYKRPELVLDIGVKGMVNVLDSCIAEGVKELMLLSSSEAYQTPPAVPTSETTPLLVPDPLNPRYSYGGGKIISELMAINYGRKYFNKVTVVRPHNVYGPDMGWEHVIPQFIIRMKELVKGRSDTIEFPIQGTGKETRAFVYVDDFIDGLMAVLGKGSHLEIYHIGTTEELTIAALAAEVGAYFGKKIIVVAGTAAKGGTLRRCPDIEKVRKLGYEPKVVLREGLKKTALWYIENIGLMPKHELEGEVWIKRRP